MKRRDFFTASAGTTAVLTGINGCENNASKTQQPLPLKSESMVTDNGKLAGYTLEELRELFRVDLYDDFLPFFDKYVIDHEYGGFMCTVNLDGSRVNTSKSTMFEGRGIMVYSYLYNKIEQNPKYLEVAKKSVEFVLNNKPTGSDLLPAGFTREGKPTGENKRVWIDIFFAYGLQEFSKIKGNEEYWDLAKQMLKNAMDIYNNRPNYDTLPTNYEGALDKNQELEMPLYINPRDMRHHYFLLPPLISMLEHKSDPEVEAMIKENVDAIMNKFWNPEYRLVMLYLDHDFSLPDNDYYSKIFTDSAMESLWMVLWDAVRRKDKQLFDTALERYKRATEVMWDDVYGGFYYDCHDIDENHWLLRKACLQQAECCECTLFVIEHSGDQWAKEWYSKVHTYLRDKWPNKPHGLPLWTIYADRKVTFDPTVTRAENFHHPRFLMFNLTMLDRMIKRGGKVYNPFV